jgi:glycosyltransferase involved in cell wall biosynthesis
MKKVLIITYYWPPSGGAGVQRWLKFSRHLPELGWEPLVLTVDPRFATFPTTDPSLTNDIPGCLKVYMTRATDWFRIYAKNKKSVPTAGFANNIDNSFKGKLTRFIRGNLFIPDPRRGWNKYAFKKACDLIESVHISAILTTSPPHSTQLIGLKLKKKYPSIRWVADLRDPWTEIYYYDLFYPTFLSRRIDSFYEKSVLKHCDKIITVGQSLKESFARKIDGSDNKIEVITNGYDESDFSGKEVMSPSTFTITYVGTLSEVYPIDGLLAALKKIHEEKRSFIMRFVGIVPSAIKDRILRNIPPDFVDFIPYTIHSEAISFMLNSSILLLIIPDNKNNRNIITGKIFEYAASTKRVLCLGPEDGDAAKIVNEANLGKCFSYNDADKIAGFIMDEMNGRSVMPPRDPLQFSHRNLIKKLVSCL